MFVIPKDTSEQCNSSSSSDAMPDSTEERSKTLHQRNTHRTYGVNTGTTNTKYRYLFLCNICRINTRERLSHLNVLVVSTF